MSSNTTKHARRVQAIARQLQPSNSLNGNQDESTTTAMCSGSASSSTATQHEQQKPTYASVSGQSSSYARVHGEVSTVPVQWRRIGSIRQEKLQEVLYDKSVGEGIAKVWVVRCGVGRCVQRKICFMKAQTLHR